MGNDTQSTLDFGSMGEGSRVWSNTETLVNGLCPRPVIYGVVIEARSHHNLYPYVVRWQNGNEEIHSREELTRATTDEILKEEP